jgi:fructose-bisphosphate aldolase class II
MGTAEVLLPYGPLEEVSYYLIPMAKKASVPVVIHLDHGLTYDTCVKALKLGFSSVMYDCSTDSYEENVRKVKEMADIAHSYGATIEGELGHVGMTSDDDMDEFTTPEDAKRFVEETGVACLAVAVGTAHGRYSKPPKLDIERIKDIRKATNNAALVLHGGSGVPDEEIKKAVAAGIRKMNFATDICYAFLDTCLEELQKPDRAVAIDTFMKKPIEAVKDFCITRIKLVGADGKA